LQVYYLSLRTLMSAAGTAIVSTAVDAHVGIANVLRWMAIGALLPGLLWFVWLMSVPVADEPVTETIRR